MQAVAFLANGGTEVLEMLEVPEPVPGRGQVAVQVAFAGVNFAEIQHRRGEFGAPDGPGGADVPGLELWRLRGDGRRRHSFRPLAANRRRRS